MPYDKGFAEHICSQLTSYTEECVKYLTTQTPKSDEEFLSKMEQITQQSRGYIIQKLRECKPCKEAKERIKAKREEMRRKEEEAKRASATAKNVGLILLGIGAIAFTSYLIYKLLKR